MEISLLFLFSHAMVYVFRIAVVTVAAMVSYLHEPRKFAAMVRVFRRHGSYLHEPQKLKDGNFVVVFIFTPPWFMSSEPQ
jgi:hypothetical protein